MKILHTADWHLGTFRSPVKDGVNLRTEDTKRCLDELIRVANEEKPDYSLVSGDIFHVGRLWSDRCCEEIITAIHYIRELAAVSKQVVVMRGTPNHDGSGQFNVLSEMFADVPNVHVVITPQVISFDDVDIAVLPGFDRGVFRANHPGLSSDEENVVFTNELSNIVTGLKAQCSPEKKSILMAHYTVPGCNTESGQTMMLTQFEPIIPQEALLAANYNLVALGHIHRPQKIMHRDWYYSGAINAMNFNDEGQQRGFWIHNWHELGTWQSTVNDILDDEDDWEAMVDDAPVNANESAETSNTALSAETKAPKEQEETETDSATDTTIPTGCGVIVVKDGKVLVGTRKDNGLVCGPGGHIEIGETPEDAAIRETREEFGINIANIIPVTLISGMSEQYCPSQVFLCTEYYGNPICFNTEMEDARFEDIGSVLDMDLFLPFRLSLEDFLRQLDEIRLTAEISQSNMEADGGPGSGRYPKGSGKKNEKSGSKKKKSQSLPMTAKEKAKVTHDINNVYHAKYKGKSSCYIRTHSNEPDSPAYVYRFRNHGFDDYEIYMKEPCFLAIVACELVALPLYKSSQLVNCPVP